MERGEHLALLHGGGAHLQPPSSSPVQERLSFDLQMELSAVPFWINHAEISLAVSVSVLLCSRSSPLSFTDVKGFSGLKVKAGL